LGRAETVFSKSEHRFHFEKTIFKLGALLMNAPAMQGLNLNAPSYVKNAKLIAWVAEMAALTKAGCHLLVRWLR
jgi:hypothetical protein